MDYLKSFAVSAAGMAIQVFKTGTAMIRGGPVCPVEQSEFRLLTQGV